jgi:hypothetical protein
MHMKFTLTLIIALAAAFSFGQHSQVKKEQDCCAAKAKVVAQVDKKDACCDAEAKVAKKQDDCCGDKSAKAKEDAFMAEAHKMMAQAEGKDECCKSTAAVVKMKGDPGCCNEKGVAAKFKVFVAGEGYKFFGCEGSAGKGRAELIAKGAKVGKIQKVTSKASKIA